MIIRREIVNGKDGYYIHLEVSPELMAQIFEKGKRDDLLVGPAVLALIEDWAAPEENELGDGVVGAVLGLIEDPVSDEIEIDDDDGKLSAVIKLAEFKNVEDYRASVAEELDWGGMERSNGYRERGVR